MSELSLAEGWALFNLDTHPEIQRDDEAGVFATDEDAIAYVRSRSRWSRRHKLALQIATLA